MRAGKFIFHKTRWQPGGSLIGINVAAQAEFLFPLGNFNFAMKVFQLIRLELPGLSNKVLFLKSQQFVDASHIYKYLHNYAYNSIYISDSLL